MDLVCAFHCGISHFIIVFVSCVCCGWFQNRLCWYFDEITWVGWSRSWDCTAQLRYCVYQATALDIDTSNMSSPAYVSLLKTSSPVLYGRDIFQNIPSGIKVILSWEFSYLCFGWNWCGHIIMYLRTKSRLKYIHSEYKQLNSCIFLLNENCRIPFIKIIS